MTTRGVRKNTATTVDEESEIFADARVVFGGLWLVSLALQFYASPDWLTASIRVVDPPMDCVLADGAGWSSPLSLLADGVFAEWPFLLFAPVAAGFVAMAGLRLTSLTAGWLVAAFVVGASLAIEPQHLLPAVLISTMAALSRLKLDGKQPEVALRILVGCSIVGALATIEFGFVILFAVCLLPTIVAALSNRRRGLVELGGVLLLGLLVLILCGSTGDFASALLRPVSWLWTPTQAVGMTSTAFALSGESVTLPRILLAVFLIGAWGSRFCGGLDRQTGDGPPLLPLLATSLIGLCCGRFFWLGACSASTLDDRVSPRESQNWNRQFLAATVAIVALAEGSTLLTADATSPLRPARSTELVDPVAWEVSGHVLLMDLEQSSGWQTEKSRRKFRLLIDDRWDVFGDRYLEYTAVCRDIFEVRPKSYLRANGESGGYLGKLKRWSPALLVTDSRHVERLRQLSLSPDWTLLSIDGERAILGRLDDPQIQPQRQRAAATLVTLEWPVRPLNMIDSVLVAGDDEDLRRVAAVLCAIRLPYAALRTLPDDEFWPTQKIRTWCFLELAHRTRRHSGEISLLDQFRALALVRKIHEAGRWNAEELLRLARSLEGLGQLDFAEKLAAESERAAGSSGAREAPAAHQKEALVVRNRIRQRLKTKEKTPGAPATSSSASEVRLRLAMASGRAMLAREKLAQLDAGRTEVFGVLVSGPEKNAPETNAAKLTSELLRVLERDGSSAAALQEPSSQLRGEFFFVLGGVALESGQIGIAAAAFTESARLAPHSPFENIRQMHLQRLGAQ